MCRKLPSEPIRVKFNYPHKHDWQVAHTVELLSLLILIIN